MTQRTQEDRPRIGSPEHKELFCKFFIDTHVRFSPAELPWPELDSACLARLKSLPIWEEAVTTEARTAMIVTECGRAQKDPLMGEAISLQGLEEQRHADMLRLLTKRYGIPVDREPDLTPPRDPTWAFLRMGYGECFDSFFAFGLFRIAQESGFFTPNLVRLFETVMQEEARHILFIANWAAYTQARMPAFKRPTFLFRRGLALWLQTLSRVRTAMSLGNGDAPDQDNFTLKAHESFGDFSLRRFLETCLSENARRFQAYDAHLLRPLVVPTLARTSLALMPRASAERS